MITIFKIDRDLQRPSVLESLAQIHPLAAFELEITVDNSFSVYQVALCVESIESSLSG